MPAPPHMHTISRNLVLNYWINVLLGLLKKGLPQKRSTYIQGNALVIYTKYSMLDDLPKVVKEGTQWAGIE